MGAIVDADVGDKDAVMNVGVIVGFGRVGTAVVVDVGNAGVGA